MSIASQLDRPLARVGAVITQVLVVGLIVANAFGDSTLPGMSSTHLAELDDRYAPVVPAIGCGGDKFSDTPTPRPDFWDLEMGTKEIRRLLWIDEAGDTAISDFGAPSYVKLSKSLLEKVLGIGAGEGANTGANSARARSLRWILRYRIADGQDHLAHLRDLKAVLLVPIPPENERCLLFHDLNDPNNRTIASDAELRSLNRLIRFGEVRPDAVSRLCAELGVLEPANVFFAYFPKEMQDELARKEIGYRNRRSADVAETVFRIRFSDVAHEIVVDDQKAQR